MELQKCFDVLYKNMKKIIITGANGFVGSCLAKNFVESGFEVTAIVRNEKSDISSISKINGLKIVYCNLEEINNLHKILTDKYDLFFHLAWDSSAGEKRSDVGIQLSNVEYTCNAVKEAKKLGCKRFIFANSIMSYEAREYISNDNSNPTLGYIYSTAKLTAGMMAKTIAVSEKIEYIDVIISNIYGVGEKSMRFLNSTVRKIISCESLKLTSCQQIYDFIYITDAAEAIKIASINGKNLNSYYIGNKTQRKLKDYVLDIKETLKSDVKIEFGAVPFNGAYFNYSDITDTNKIFKLGFKINVDFKTGIKMLADSI